MIRTDGDFEVFVLYVKFSSKDPEWFQASLDHFGTPPGFSASDMCWQVTGISGTFDPAIGLEALTWMSDKHPEYDWKLVEISISQSKRDVAQMHQRKE